MDGLVTVLLLASSMACSFAQNEMVIAEVPVAFPTHTVTAIPSTTADGTFQLRWSWDANDTTTISLITYAGVGFQNGVAATATGLTMFGPMGADYFIARGNSDGAAAEFRFLAAQEGGGLVGQLPRRIQTIMATSNASANDRIQSLVVSAATQVSYTITVRCQAASGQTGQVNYSQPVSVLFATGSYLTGISYHGSGKAGRRRVALGGNLELFTLCPAAATTAPASTAPASTAASTTPATTAVMTTASTRSEVILGEFPTSTSQTLRWIAIPSDTADGTFQIRVTRDMSNTLISGAAWFGLGFQNGVSTDASRLTMYGPNGADYFILKGDTGSSAAEFRYLAAGGSGSGTRPTLSETKTVMSSSSQSDRIRSLEEISGSQVVYTITIRCQAASGRDGQVDFSQPVSILHAWGSYSSNNIQYHNTNRGRRRTTSSHLELVTLCGSSTHTASTTTSSASCSLTSILLPLLAAIMAVFYAF